MFYLLVNHYVSTRQKAHKAVTLSDQPALFCAVVLAILLLVQPALSRYFSTVLLQVLLQVLLCLHLALRPSDLHYSAVTQSFFPPLLSTCMALGGYSLIWAK